MDAGFAGCSAVQCAAGYPLACSCLVTRRTKDQVSVWSIDEDKKSKRAVEPAEETSVSLRKV
jgi:hypothetical protein